MNFIVTDAMITEIILVENFLQSVLATLVHWNEYAENERLEGYMTLNIEEIELILKNPSSKEYLFLPCDVAESVVDVDDFIYSQNLCIKLSESDDEYVRANAILGFGYLARVTENLDIDKVLPIVKAEWLKHSSYQSRIEDAIDDINIYLNWNIQKSEF